MFSEPRAVLSIQAGLGWHKQHTAVPLGKLIVKGSGWGFERACAIFMTVVDFFSPPLFNSMWPITLQHSTAGDHAGGAN